jgi:glycosyltransferase involved in cell wall biosynthesis
MKLIAYANDWAPSVGGIETVTMVLARGLAAWEATHPGERIAVTVVTQTPANGMNDSALPFRVVRRPSQLEFAKLVRSADIVHVANPAFMPLLFGWFFRKPTVLEHDGYQSICPNGLLVYQLDRSVCPRHFMAGRYGKCLRCNSVAMGWAKSLRLLLLTFPRRWLARRVARNVAPTNHVGQRVALPRTQIMYHGVPDLAPSCPVATTDRVESPPCFAFIGRLVLEKGLPVLLLASKKLSQNGYSFRLRIVGDGSERAKLEQMTDELGLRDRTEFVGAVPLDAIPGLLANATAVVMPSVWEDVAPLAASELLMQGQLVIASDIGGLSEIVDGAGLRFPAGDSDALESCMRQVIENPKMATELRRKARQRGVEVFSEKRMLEEHAHLYQSLLGRRQTT